LSAIERIHRGISADIVAFVVASQRAEAKSAEFVTLAGQTAGPAVVGIGVCVYAGAAAVLQAFVATVLAHA